MKRTIENWRLIDWEKIDNLPDDTQSELDSKQDLSEKWQPDGYASLDWTWKVPIAQIPDISWTWDMKKVVYDPTWVNDDAFDMDNMSEGTTNKILTATERNKLDNVPTDTNAELDNKIDKTTNVDNAIMKADWTTWDLQDSWVTIDDNDNINEASSIKLNTWLTNPTHEEWRVFYDNTQKALSYYNEEPEVEVELGKDVFFRIFNDSGATLTKGIIMAFSESGVTIADRRFKDKSRSVAVAAHNIENNSYGYVTRIGNVSWLDTSAYSVREQLYLWENWQFTNTTPDDWAYLIRMGSVNISDNTNWEITVNPTISELTVEVTDTNWFTSDQRSWTTLAFDDLTRTFTIAPTWTEFHYYQLWEKFEKTWSQTLIIEDTEWLHVVYYDMETLMSIVNPSAAQIDEVIREKCIVSYVYRDATNNSHCYLADERHGISMSPDTHAYLHFTRWAQFLSWLWLNNTITDASWDLDTHAQFGTELWLIADEDLITTAPPIASTTWLEIFYLEWTTPDLRCTTNVWFSVLTTWTGRLAYNENVGWAWQLTEITNNDFVLCHVFAVNAYSDNKKVIAFIWQNSYTTVSNARAWANTEISNLLSQIPFEEKVPLWTVIFQTSSGYTNAVKARIRSTDTGEDYVDWRTTELAQWVAPSSHANLTNLELANTWVTYWHINDQAQTIYWDKTFNDNISANNLSWTNTWDQDLSSYATKTWTETLTNKTMDWDNNTFSNLDIGNEVDWAAATDVADRTAFASWDKMLIYEAWVGLRKIDYDDLPSGWGWWAVETLFSYNTWNNLPDSTREVVAYRAGQTWTLSEVNVYVDTAPTWSNATVVVKKNWTSIWTVTITASTTSWSQTTFSDTTIAKWDKFTFEATGWSTVAGWWGYTINFNVS